MFKKSLIAALLLSAFVGKTYAQFDVSENAGEVVVKGSGTYGELWQIFENDGYNEAGAMTFLRFTDGCEISFSEGDPTTAPLAGMIQFESAVLTFEDLVTLKPDFEKTGWGPGMLVGTSTFDTEKGDWVNTPGQLTINVSTAAVQTWLDKQSSLLDMSGYPVMLSIAEIRPTGSDNVQLNFYDETGNGPISIGNQFEYRDQVFTNVGVVLNEGDVRANQIGLMFTQGGQGEWGAGSLVLVALGSEYVNPNPTVPEPTTGTLSLLALAGLAARRRRK